MSELHSKSEPTPEPKPQTAVQSGDDESDYVKPSIYVISMMRKLAFSVPDGSDIDWEEVSKKMPKHHTPEMCKMIYQWFKDTHGFFGLQIPAVVIPRSRSPESVNTSTTSLSSSSGSSTYVDSFEVQSTVFTRGSEAVASETFSNESLISWYTAASTEYLSGSTMTKDNLEVSNVGSSTNSASLHRERMVRILVKDYGRSAERVFDFTCSMLAAHMPFFGERFEEVTVEGDVEISLHVDLVVFEKLMAYVDLAKEGDEQSYKIDPDYAIHLLVAADYLHMTPLVDKCLDYCHRHLNTIVQGRSPLGSMTDGLIGKLARCFNHREVEALEDPKDRIKGKLYRKLLDKLLIPEDECPGQPGTPKLYRCVLCEQIFATDLRYLIPCKHKKRALGYRGELIYYHQRDTDWNVERYLEEQFKSAESWRRVYWQVWGLLSFLYCTACEHKFCCADFTRCRYHKESLQFPPSDGEKHSFHQLGTFPCCGRTAYKFDPLDPLHVDYGCSYKNHTVIPEAKPGDTYQDMLSYYDLIYQTRPVELNSSEYSGLQRIVPFFSDKIVNDWSVLSTGVRAPKPRKSVPKKSGSGEMLPEVPVPECETFVPLLSSLTMPSKVYNLKPAWKMRTTHWHNQDIIREHDNVLLERLMAILQNRMQPTPRTRHSTRK